MFAYVIEDGEIVEKIEGQSFGDIEAKELCETFFDQEWVEMDDESGGVLYSVSEVEMVFVTDKDVENVEDLWGE